MPSSLTAVREAHIIQINYSTDSNDAPSLPPTLSSRLSSKPRDDYVSRRMQLNYDCVDSNTISRHPAKLQVAFRRKMFAMLALQLLFVWILVSICAFVPQIPDNIGEFFGEHTVWYTIVVFLAALVLLYFGRELQPFKWAALLLFSLAQALLLAVLGFKESSSVVASNCGFTFCCVVIMALLFGLRGRGHADKQPELISATTAGFVAFVATALISCAVYLAFGRELFSAKAFCESLALQFVLVMWFALDAASMYHVMFPDEFPSGVIYCYSDMILVIAMALLNVLVAACVVIWTEDRCSRDFWTDFRRGWCCCCPNRACYKPKSEVR